MGIVYKQNVNFLHLCAIGPTDHLDFHGKSQDLVGVRIHLSFTPRPISHEMSKKRADQNAYQLLVRSFSLNTTHTINLPCIQYH